MGSYRISILGTGFIGLCSAVCFGDRGFEVICSTHDPKKADLINKGIPPFYEPELEPMLKRSVESGAVRCTTSPEEAVLETDISMMTVGTPMREDKSIDLQFIESTAREIGEALAKKDDYHLVAARSTIVPGTTRNLIAPNIIEHSGKRVGADFGLCMQPEFLAEGRSIEDTLRPDRIIIGEYDKRSGEMLQELYEDFYGDHLENCPILRMNLESAELVKYGNNLLLSTKVSYANELSRIAEFVPGVDIVQVMKGVGLDYRINPAHTRAGVGFGGSCFPKDVNAIIAFSKSQGYTPRIFEAVLSVNDAQAKHVVHIAEEELGDLTGKRVSLLGLAFKEDTDDMREAPSIRIVRHLKERGAHIIGYDPIANKTAYVVFKDSIEYAQDIPEALKGSDCAMIVTPWEQFKTLQPVDFRQHMKTPFVIDGRRILDPEVFSRDERVRFRAMGLIQRPQ